MIEYESLYDRLSGTRLSRWLDRLRGDIQHALDPERNGDLIRWKALIDALPPLSPSSVDLQASAIRAGMEADCTADERSRLGESLMQFHPWRKGPYKVFGLTLDTEWRSDLKWDRLAGRIQPLEGRIVLDIGCGNGYHAWRMRGEGARLVVGIDPMHLFVMQHWALTRYLGPHPVYVAPLKVQQLPSSLTGFDTVFSMGVLYHRRSPLGHLLQARSLLREGGELVLETLVVDGEEGYSLLPEERYAKMRNVWFVPSPSTLVQWMKRCGFKEVVVVDVATTTIEEQRATPWMTFESLPDFLDPADPTKTIEGYPAPQRAIVIAKK